MSYMFKDHDPIIDIVRTCIQIFAATRNISFGKAVKVLARDASYGAGQCVSTSCIYNWMNGYTKYPRFCTVVAVVHATGREFAVDGVHGKIGGSKPRFKVIKGGKKAA